MADLLYNSVELNVEVMVYLWRHGETFIGWECCWRSVADKDNGSQQLEHMRWWRVSDQSERGPGV